MSRARRHEASYGTLSVGEQIELYEVGERPNSDVPPTPRWDGAVEVLDVVEEGERWRVRTANRRDYGRQHDAYEDEYTAYRVEGS